jgi:glucose-6-phosphate isomerase
MPYSNKLVPFASWYCQLWAESLGKQGRGLTPVRAFGPLDQHSQLQLYLDGPSDKFFTLLVLDAGGRGARVALDGLDDPRIAYLGGRTLGDVVAAAQRSTAETLAASGRPTRVIELSDVDELTMGTIFMHFMLETVIAAKLLGVDPFDQPAVEDGKARARAHLSKAH